MEGFFTTYKNEGGGEDCIEVCLIREGRRAVVMAEEEINRLQAENERLSKFCGILLRNGSELFKEIQTAKAEAYKECLEKIEQRDVSESDFYVMVKKTEFDNLSNELAGENNT